MQKLFNRSLAAILSAVILFSLILSIPAFATETYFTQWTDDDAALNGVNHVALDGAPETDGNYNNYTYAAQTFVPSETNLSGVKLKFNLTAGNATIHIEIREDINGQAIFSKNIAVESLGNGGYWYTFNFKDNVTLTAGNSYCIVWYAVDRTDTSLMINYAADNSANTNPAAYAHKMGTTTFNQVSNITFGFQLITDEYIPYSFSKWTDTDAALNPVNHVALDGAPVTDGNYNNYQYAAQTFIPNKENISGVKLMFNLTAGTATIHTEIRSSVNETALYEKDVDIQSLGDGGYWYTLNFDQNFEVTPYETYYLVWYAVDRTETSTLLNYATNNSSNTNPDSYLHGMGNTTFEKNSTLTFGFELITDEYIPYSFSKWTDTDAALNPVNHVALDGAPVTDGNYNNYQYAAQAFIPNKENISGVKLMFNLTAGTAKVHVEIREDVDSAALFSKEVDIQSLGDGGHWYTLDFNQNFKVTPYETYYLVWYVVDRTSTSVMINYATINSSNTNPSSYTHNMTNKNFSKTPELTFGFEIITDEYEAFSFVKWTEEDAAINGVNHVALDGAPETDGNYNNYHYIAQTFIPKENNISGAMLMFNLTAGTAKIHIEIRASVNGAALYSKELDIESLGNGGYWYTFNFGEDVEVAPYQEYYLVWYAVERTSTSLLINYATDNTANTNPSAYSHGMSSNTFASVSNLTYAFQLITDITGNPAISVSKRVIDAINTLPATDSITLANEAQINQIRSMYKDLTEAQKSEVTNYNLLEAAEGKIEQLYYQQTIDAVIDTINSLPQPSEISLVFEKDIDSARLLYDGLTAEGKQLVTNYNVLQKAEEKIGQLEEILIDTANAQKISDSSNANMTAYGLPIGWKINPGQTNSWLMFNFNNDFGEGKYKMAVKVKLENITSAAPVVAIKTTDNSDGDKEVLKTEFGYAEYEAAEKDADGFAVIYSDQFVVTPELSTHTLEGKVLVYNEFHGTDAVIIFGGVYWVDADDTSVVYKQVTDLQNYSAKVLAGTVAYSDLIDHVEYAYDSAKESTAEVGYTVTGLSFGTLDAGKYYTELEYSVSEETSGSMYDIEVYAGETKIKSMTVAVSDYLSALKNSSGHAALPVDFELESSAGVVIKIYQYNTATVDYYNLRMFRTELYVDKAVEAVIALINALPLAKDITLDDEDEILAADSAYNELTSEQKEQITNYEKLTAAIDALENLKLGDVNNDGKVTAADALLALQSSVKKITLDQDQTTAADVNKDGEVTANDALLILQYSVGKISSF